MPLIYPYTLVPERVDDLVLPVKGVSISRPRAGAETRVKFSDVGRDASFSVTYEGRDPKDFCEIMDFWWKCDGNFRSFYIPFQHKLWQHVSCVEKLHSILPNVHPELGAIWRFEERFPLETPFDNIHTWKATIKQADN